MLIFIVLIGTIDMFLLIVSGAAMMTLSDKWDHYSENYDRLDNIKFKDVEEQIWGYDETDPQKCVPKTQKSFIVFKDGPEFKIDESAYLHNNEVTFWDPYSLYWWFKYRSWFKQNTDYL